MKALYSFTVVILLLALTAFSQTPQAFKYQAIARDNAGEILANQAVSFRMSVIQGTLPGTIVYTETHSVTTNDFGLATLEIGKGTVVSGNFSTINWSISPVFLKTELDPTGGSSYIDMGTSELLSVPYALYAGTSGSSWNLNGNSGTNATSDYIGTTDNTSFNIRANNLRSGWIDLNGKNTSLGYSALKENISGLNNVAFGTEALSGNTTGSNNIAIGEKALANSSVNSDNIAIGARTLYYSNGGDYNTGIGSEALYYTSTGWGNSAIGKATLHDNRDGYMNTACGYYALNANYSARHNTGIGAFALYTNVAGQYNTATGSYALQNSTGSSNSAFGFQAFLNNGSGSENSIFGSEAFAQNMIGSGNVALGFQAGYFETGSNKLYIDNRMRSNQSDGRLKALVYGVFDADPANQTLTFNANVGIGSISPSNKLHIVATSNPLRLEGLQTSANTDYLVVDANGVVSKRTGTGSSGWALTGNTVTGTEKLGTLNNYALNFITNNTDRMRITESGNVGIGNTGPVYKLDIGNTNLESTAGSTVAWQRVAGSSGNIDQLRIFHRRYTEGSSWTSAEIRIQKTVDVTDQNFISFKGGSTTSIGSLAFGFGTSEHMLINSNGNVGIGTSNPEATAALDVSSTTRGFLPPRMSAYDIASIPSPANGLTVFNVTDAHLYVYTQWDNKWKMVAYDTQIIIPWTCGSTFWTGHSAGDIAPVSKTVTYGTVMTNLTGSNKCWITQNLGADHQASSATDATEASAGWYWQFNQKQGYKHDGTTRTPNTIWITSINENSDWISANDPCALLLGTGWRLPTITEWNNADVNGGWNNYNQTYASVLKLHAAGYFYYSNGALNNRGSNGSYWSSWQNSSTLGGTLLFSSSSSYMNYSYKSYGFSSRCLKD